MNKEEKILAIVLILFSIWTIYLGYLYINQANAKETTITATVETSPYYECVSRCEADYLINK